jgi:hypothetical protein
MLFKCTKNFIMEEGETSFTKGTVYDFYFTDDEWMTCKSDDEDVTHQMNIFNDMWNHFEPVEDE